MYKSIVLCLINIVTDTSSDTYSPESFYGQKVAPIGIPMGDNGQHEFVVALINIDTIMNVTIRFCTATMLKPAWAITAAHCTSSMNNIESVHIWYGEYTKSPLVTKLYSQVLSIQAHPDYNYAHVTATALKNDICLLHTEQIQLNNYARVLSNDYKSMTGQSATYVHTGKMFGKDVLYDMVFKETMISPCEKKVYQLVGKHFVCISPMCSKMNNRTTDNGGPLLYDGYIIAVSSGRSVGYIDMECFVPIIDYIGWINKVVEATNDTVHPAL